MNSPSAKAPHRRLTPLLFREQVLSLHANTPAALIANGVVALVLGWLHLGVTPPSELSIWLGTMGLVLSLRLALHFRFQRIAGGDFDADLWLRRFRVCSLLSGLIWCLASLLLFTSGETPHQTFIAFALAGLTAGAVTTLSVDLFSMLTFMFPSLGAMILRLFAEGSEITIAMGVLVVLFLLLSSLIARRAHHTLLENLSLRIAACEHEETLRDNEERLKEAQRIARVGSFDWDLTTGRVHWSDEHFRLWGLEPQKESPGPALALKYVHPEDRWKLEEATREIQSPGGGERHTDFRVIGADGVERYIQCHSEVEYDDADQPVYIRGTVQDVSEQKRMEHLLGEQKQVFSSLVESSPDNIVRYDRDCRVAFLNHRLSETVHEDAQQLLGRRPLEAPLEGVVGLDRYEATLEEVIATGVSADVNLAVTDPSGDHRAHNVRFVAERDEQGEIIGALAFGRDITDLKRTEAELRLAAIALDSREGIFITDPERCIVKVNRAFTEITGYSAEEALGRRPDDLLRSDRQNDEFFEHMSFCLEQDQYWEGEIWNRRKNGDVYPEWLSLTVVKDEQGRVTHYVASFRDITRQKRDQKTIHNLAFFDPLTELPNRRLLLDRLQHMLASTLRNGRHGAVLFIDLDHFKELNDTKGHGIGDELLTEVAGRLVASVRDDDTVARLGGDEFVVVLNDLDIRREKAELQAETIAEKIRAAVNRPFLLQEKEYHSSPSIGISMFGGTEITIEELLKRADIAMYQAKRSGRNTIRFFDPKTQASMEARIALEAELRSAVPEEQLRLHYQMQVDHRGHVFGAEVLLRWEHPQRGLVSPLDFIPLAEDSGLIVPIGQWVLHTACAQLKAWQDDPLLRHLILAVNVSPRQFHQADFVDQVTRAIAENDAEPHRLKLELTESLVLDNIDDTIAKMAALKQLGVRFSMDDFGTGYSSLAYLSQLPMDQVKIDRSFVSNIGKKSSDSVIVETIIGMANTLNMEVIAEGVETLEQRDFLKRSGCSNYQGFLFGRPVPVEEFESTLRHGPNAYLPSAYLPSAVPAEINSG